VHFAGALGGNRIVTDHLHPNAARQLRDVRADAAEAYDAHRLAAQSVPSKRLRPIPAASPPGVRNAPTRASSNHACSPALTVLAPEYHDRDAPSGCSGTSIVSTPCLLARRRAGAAAGHQRAVTRVSLRTISACAPAIAYPAPPACPRRPRLRCQMYWTAGRDRSSLPDRRRRRATVIPARAINGNSSSSA